MEHITLTRGDDYSETVTIKQPNGTAYDLTGCTLWFTLKRALTDPDPGVFQHKTGVGTALVITNAAGGLATHRITAAESAALSVRVQYRWDLQLKAADGTVATVLSGTLVAEPDATRNTV